MQRHEPQKSHIGRIMRVEYRYDTGPKQPIRGVKARGNSKERPCVVVGVRGDYYAVAPISHSASQDDLKLAPEHQKAARLGDGEGFIERGEYNLVHRNSSSIRPDRKTGEMFGGSLPPGVTAQLSGDFNAKFADRTLNARLHKDDLAPAREALAKRQAAREAAAPDTGLEARVAAAAKALKERGGSLPSLGTQAPPARPRLGLGPKRASGDSAR
jgi:hypothetical protein